LPLAGCNRAQEPSLKAAAPLTGEALVQRGRSIYVANCISCHASDPKKAGSLGPDLFGSSKELLRGRMVLGTYPEGYTPKRKTGVMPKFPFLEKEIDALHAYLNSN
jgi:mono/diheme cytochrome c family protein